MRLHITYDRDGRTAKVRGSLGYEQLLLDRGFRGFPMRDSLLVSRANAEALEVVARGEHWAIEVCDEMPSGGGAA